MAKNKFPPPPIQYENNGFMWYVGLLSPFLGVVFFLPILILVPMVGALVLGGAYLFGTIPALVSGWVFLILGRRFGYGYFLAMACGAVGGSVAFIIPASHEPLTSGQIWGLIKMGAFCGASSAAMTLTWFERAQAKK